MPTAKKDRMTVAQILEARQEELLLTWLENLHSLPGSRTLELMDEEQLRVQATELLGTLITAFSYEEYEEITGPEFADSVALLQEISASRAQQGFTPSETATFVLSLKDALFPSLQDEYGDDPAQLNAVVIRMNKVIDKLALVTFETHAASQQEIIVEQARSVLELSTPVIRLWDEIILLPLVGVVDTMRAAQMTERMLNTIVDTESRVAILDITGVPVIDTYVARHLMRTTAAAKMLGAEVIITGISPDAAQTLTHLGIDLGAVVTRGTLRSGVEKAFGMLGKRITDRQGGIR